MITTYFSIFMFRPRWAAIVTTTMYRLNVFEPSASFNKTCLSFSHKLLYLPISSIGTSQVVKSREISHITNQSTVLAKLHSIKERSGHRIVIASVLTKRVTGSPFQLSAQPTIEDATQNRACDVAPRATPPFG